VTVPYRCTASGLHRPAPVASLVTRRRPPWPVVGVTEMTKTGRDRVRDLESGASAAEPRSPLRVFARLGGVALDQLVTVSGGSLLLEVEGGPSAKYEAVVYRMDAGPWEPLEEVGETWRAELPRDSLAWGFHTLEIMAVDQGGQRGTVEATFRVRT